MISVLTIRPWANFKRGKYWLFLSRMAITSSVETKLYGLTEVSFAYAKKRVPRGIVM